MECLWRAERYTSHRPFTNRENATFPGPTGIGQSGGCQGTSALSDLNLGVGLSDSLGRLRCFAGSPTPNLSVDKALVYIDARQSSDLLGYDHYRRLGPRASRRKRAALGASMDRIAHGDGESPRSPPGGGSRITITFISLPHRAMSIARVRLHRVGTAASGVSSVDAVPACSWLHSRRQSTSPATSFLNKDLTCAYL